jgi:hypothetical protein
MGSVGAAVGAKLSSIARTVDQGVSDTLTSEQGGIHNGGLMSFQRETTLAAKARKKSQREIGPSVASRLMNTSMTLALIISNVSLALGCFTIA